MSDRLVGKTALITGGTSGIGFATATRFLAEGARVAVTGRDSERVTRASEALGAGAIAIRSDAGKIAELEPLVRRIEGSFGRLDILFLNAGFSPYCDLRSVTERFFDETFAVNTKAILFYAQRFAPLMNPGGSIIVTTSITNRMGMAQTHVYAAAKAAAGSLVRTLAGELASLGLRVNALSPGPVSTEAGSRTGLSDSELQAVKDWVISKVPMRRFASPEELAAAALFLASADSSFVTGQEVIVDGGWTGIG